MAELISLNEAKKLLASSQKRLDEIAKKCVEPRAFWKRTDHHRVVLKDQLKQLRDDREIAVLEEKSEAEINILNGKIKNVEYQLDNFDAKVNATRVFLRKLDAEEREIKDTIPKLTFRINNDAVIQDIVKNYSPAIRPFASRVKNLVATAAKCGIELDVPPLVDFAVGQYGELRTVFLYRGKESEDVKF